MTDTGPLFVSSGDLVSDRRYKAAVELAARGDFAAAADVLTQTVEAAPGFATAWFALGAMPARRSRRRGGGFSCREPRRPAGLSRRAAAAGAVRRRRGDAGHDRALCAAAIRPICRPLRRRADRAFALSRPGAPFGGSERAACRIEFRLKLSSSLNSARRALHSWSAASSLARAQRRPTRPAVL